MHVFYVWCCLARTKFQALSKTTPHPQVLWLSPQRGPKLPRRRQKPLASQIVPGFNILPMAKITPSALVAEIRGNVGDVCYARNLGGAYVRARLVRVEPWTDLQVMYRGFFGAAGALWNSYLTQSQRDAWCAAAAQFEARDRLNQTIKLAGHNLFQKVNAACLWNFEGLVLDPPANFATLDVPTITIDVATSSPQELCVTCSRTPEVNEYFIFRATPGCNVGKMQPGNRFGYSGGATWETEWPLDLTDVYTEFHGPLISGKKIWVEARTIWSLTGAINASSVDSAIVT